MKLFSVIRIKPSDMSRVRKESEKYNDMSDSDSYGAQSYTGSSYGRHRGEESNFNL